MTEQHYYSASTVGFYNSADHRSEDIPGDAVVITKSQRDELLDNERAGQILAANMEGGPISVAPPAPSLADAKAAKRQVINTAADTAMATVSAKYPRSEIDSWQIQTAEAAAFAADNNASTPFIDGLMAHRSGVTKSDLANKITTNKAAYTALAADVFGQRQALDDLVEAAITIADLDAIVVSIAVTG